MFRTSKTELLNPHYTKKARSNQEKGSNKTKEIGFNKTKLLRTSEYSKTFKQLAFTAIEHWESYKSN